MCFFVAKELRNEPANEFNLAKRCGILFVTSSYIVL